MVVRVPGDGELAPSCWVWTSAHCADPGQTGRWVLTGPDVTKPVSRHKIDGSSWIVDPHYRPLPKASKTAEGLYADINPFGYHDIA